jgi:nitrite reductase/ring-hydroxylating ferredoxin subunit
MSDVLEGATVTDWTLLEGIEPESATFPAAATVAGKKIWVFHLDNGGYRGVQQNCPHQRVEFGVAKLISGQTMIRCALHGFTYRLADGSPVNCRTAPIEVYEVREQEGALHARPALSGKSDKGEDS